jgi:hypothetical protein
MLHSHHGKTRYKLLKRDTAFSFFLSLRKAVRSMPAKKAKKIPGPI